MTNADDKKPDAVIAVTQSHYDALLREVDRLNRIIAKELSENDELGAEYTYVNCLREHLRMVIGVLEDQISKGGCEACELNDKLARAALTEVKWGAE